MKRGIAIMEQKLIQVVEDDNIVARTIERVLRSNEFRVNVANTGVSCLQNARREIPDLVLLDVIMPGMDGYTVCQEMRKDTLLHNVPILFLTAKTRDEDKINGFIAGADDYLSKPFNINELIFRIQAILRRTQNQVTQVTQSAQSPTDIIYGLPISNQSKVETEKNNKKVIVVGPYSLNTRTYEFSADNKTKIRLTPVQYDLLYQLMSHPGEIFSPSRLLDEVWDYPSDTGSSDLVRVHIRNLRERIEIDPRNPVIVKTVAGYGYTIENPIAD
jgi:DNA-binding response OmpR family regulator